MNALSSILKFIGSRFETIQGGYVAAQTVAGNSYTDIPVTFQKKYSSPPAVVACVSSGSTDGAIGSIAVSVNGPTETGFTLRVFNAGSSARQPGIRWIAIP